MTSLDPSESYPSSIGLMTITPQGRKQTALLLIYLAFLIWVRLRLAYKTLSLCLFFPIKPKSSGSLVDFVSLDYLFAIHYFAGDHFSYDV